MTPTTTPTAADELRETYARAMFDADHCDLEPETRDALWEDEIDNVRARFLPMVDAVLALQAPTLPVAVKEIEELLQRATARPWVADIHHAEPGSNEDDRAHVIGGYGNYAKQCLVRELSTMEGNITDRQVADAQLIVALVNAWPALRQLHAGAWSTGPAPKDVRLETLWAGKHEYCWLTDDGWMDDDKRSIIKGIPSHWKLPTPLPDAPTPPSEGE